MARNNHPKETIDKIVNTSMKLFFEKGYDSTTVQDILDNLGGLSKGAVYHHFKSKDDILEAVYEKIFSKSAYQQMGVTTLSTLNGRETLSELFYVSLSSILKMDKSELAILKKPSPNPQIFMMQYNAVFHTIVPKFIVPVIEKGIKDGSIQTKYPRASAEVILLLANLWLAPMFHKSSLEKCKENILVAADVSNALGMKIIDDRIINIYMQVCKVLI